LVHSFSIKEKRMDHALIEFRRAAARENRGRHGLQRRYSPTLRAQAVAYCRMRQRRGDGLRVVAAALGVAHWSLHRWITASARHARFHPVEIVTAETAPASLVIEFPAVGARIEHVDIETAAKLLTLVR
jgi:hypothetical protein